MKPIKHIKIKENQTIKELVKDMKETGFQAKKISQASEILKQMIEDKECKIFLGLAGAMIPAGMKNLILKLLENTSCFVSTGANLTHDLIESLGNSHYQGDENANDEELNKKGLDRIYNVFMENKVYEDLEDFFEKNWDKLKDCKDIKQFLWKLGEIVNKEDSILTKCYKNKIPIFCPALADSGIGLMIWGQKAKGKKINIDAFEDMKDIIDLAWQSKKTGILYIGGGTPKNFIQQSLQFSKGADYGIQITTDKQEYGGSSGAKLKEGISWGKMKSNAKFINVMCDATIALPLILS